MLEPAPQAHVLELLQRLFPFYFAISRELQVVHFGPKLSKVCPALQQGQPLDALFQLYRPRIKLSFAALQREERSIFLLDACGSGIRLRGQMLTEERLDLILFVGTPWFTDLQQLEQTSLELNDFTIHDPIVDFLYMIKAEQVAREDARQLADKLQRLSAAKSQFLANTSHELRTPLNGILGMTSLLLQTAQSPQQKNFTSKVLKSAEALLHVVNDILDFSKMEAGKLTLEEQDVDIGQLAFEVADLFAVTAQEKGLELVCVVEPDVPRALRGDPHRLRQVLSNLVSNAVKFTSQGEVVLRVRALAAERDHTELRFEVRDTGVGVPRDQQDRLFAAFAQVDGSTTRRYGGTGLGLAIVKQLTELMGGAVGLDSTEEKGSTFFATARLGAAEPSPAPDEQAGLAGLTGRRVLIVDDNQTARAALVQGLSAVGATCWEAGSVEAAFARLREAEGRDERPDVAVLDAVMPGLSGVELALIIAGDPRLDATRVVMLTPMNLDVLRSLDGRRLRYDATVTKPTRPAQLVQVVADVLLQPGAPPASEARAPRHSMLPGVRFSRPLGSGLDPSLPARRAPLLSRRPAASLSAARRPAASLGLTQPPPRTSLAPGARARTRVLVVDDHPVNQEVASNMVAALGYPVDVAANGREAVAAHERSRYALILTDLQMPEMDGYEATAEIRRREGPQARTPIIAMTAHAMEADRQRALDAGLDDYLAKPVRMDLLKRLLDRWTGAQAPRAAVLDRRVLGELKKYQQPGQPDVVASVVRKFLGDLPDRLKGVQAGVWAGDPAAIGRAAHALKSAGAAVGAFALSAACQDLEGACQGATQAPAPALLSRFESEAERARVALDGLLNETTTQEGPA